MKMEVLEKNKIWFLLFGNFQNSIISRIIFRFLVGRQKWDCVVIPEKALLNQFCPALVESDLVLGMVALQ